MLILGFFWITVNDVLFAFGVIILLCLHAVINIYIYLAYTERKSTWWTVKSSCDCEESFQAIPKKKLVVVNWCWMKSPGESKFRLFRWWRWLKFVLNNSRGGVLRFRHCWCHCEHFIFITWIVCIIYVQSCDLRCFLFHILEIQKILIFERLFFLQSGLLLFYLCKIQLIVTF